MSDTESERQLKLHNILKELDEEERDLLSKVIKAEQQKLHMKQPRNINEDLWKVLVETIR